METPKIHLFGFNNLTKTLSFNIYDICYAETEKEKQEYITYIDEQYNSVRLTEILIEVVKKIGAHVLNISKQDYEPQGASVNVLITEQAIEKHLIDPSCKIPEPFILKEGLLGHLDTSHLSVHTYPEYHPDKNILTFRVDIDVSTCGTISPLNALNYLINSFDSDIITLDYRVRGFTRDMNGHKHFIDHEITSIKDYIDPTILGRYDALDTNMKQANIYHTKMIINKINLENYLFLTNLNELSSNKQQDIQKNVQREMLEIYHGLNNINEERE